VYIVEALPLGDRPYYSKQLGANIMASYYDNDDNDVGNNDFGLDNVNNNPISDETALLIASAEGKGLNVDIWLADTTIVGRQGQSLLVPFHEFTLKLESLASVVGVQEDVYTKKQLAAAVSKESLKLIRSSPAVTVFPSAGGNDGKEQVVINVPQFLQLCHNKFLDTTVARPEDYDDVNNADVDDDYDGGAYAVEKYIADAKEWAGTNVPRPKSAPTGMSGRIPLGAHEHDTAVENAGTDEEDEELRYTGYRNHQIQVNSRGGGGGRAAGRYQEHGNNIVISVQRTEDDDMINMEDAEEIPIPLEDKSDKSSSNGERELSPIPGPVARPPRGVTSVTTTSRLPAKTSNTPAAAAAVAPNRDRISQSTSSAPSSAVRSASTGARASQFLRTASEIVIGNSHIGLAERLERAMNSRARAHSAERTRPQVQSVDMRAQQSKSRSTTPLRSSSASRRVSASNSSGNYSNQLHHYMLDDADRLSYLQIQVEDLVRNCVRQTDMYHIIQVHLGFIDSYTMVPARGQIVSSLKRTWSVNDHWLVSNYFIADLLSFV
jgi:hypothetical protein